MPTDLKMICEETEPKVVRLTAAAGKFLRIRPSKTTLLLSMVANVTDKFKIGLDTASAATISRALLTIPVVEATVYVPLATKILSPLAAASVANPTEAHGAELGQVPASVPVVET